jgi:hypothetical protein
MGSGFVSPELGEALRRASEVARSCQNETALTVEYLASIVKEGPAPMPKLETIIRTPKQSKPVKLSPANFNTYVPLESEPAHHDNLDVLSKEELSAVITSIDELKAKAQVDDDEKETPKEIHPELADVQARLAAIYGESGQ